MLSLPGQPPSGLSFRKGDGPRSNSQDEDHPDDNSSQVLGRRSRASESDSEDIEDNLTWGARKKPYVPLYVTYWQSEIHYRLDLLGLEQTLSLVVGVILDVPYMPSAAPFH
jgi:hypothetical protein